MFQVGGRLDLGQEAFTTYYGSQFRLQDLERNLPLVAYVLGQIDRSHATFPKLMLDGVSAFLGCIQTGNRIGHQDLGSKGCREGSIR